MIIYTDLIDAPPNKKSMVHHQCHIIYIQNVACAGTNYCPSRWSGVKEKRVLGRFLVVQDGNGERNMYTVG